MSIGKLAAGPRPGRYYNDQVAQGREDYYAARARLPACGSGRARQASGSRARRAWRGQIENRVQHAAKPEIQQPSSIARDGETRTRTGDTTIFRRGAAGVHTAKLLQINRFTSIRVGGTMLAICGSLRGIRGMRRSPSPVLGGEILRLPRARHVPWARDNRRFCWHVDGRVASPAGTQCSTSQGPGCRLREQAFTEESHPSVDD